MTHQDARFERNPDFIFRLIVNEAVLIPIHQHVADMDCIYTLNEAGARVWQKLAAPSTLAELQQVILDEYETVAQAAAQDLSRFLRQMLEIGAVRVAQPCEPVAPSQKA